MKGATLLFVRPIPMPAPASPSARKGFDYASLDTETSQFVQQQTGEIRVLMKRTAQGIIEVGQKLIEIKERLGHGRFGDWLLAEFDWTWKTATRFMNVAGQFNFDNLSNLDLAPSALYILAAPSTPKAVRSEAIARAKAGESITYTTAKAIKQKYATCTTKPKSEPEPKPEPEPEPELEPVSEPQPTLAPNPLPQSGSKLEIVALHRQTQPLALSSLTFSQAAAAPQVLLPSQPVHEPEKPGIWWQLGERHFLYCGDPNSPEFLGRITEKAGLLLAFPPTLDWHSRIFAEVRIIIADYLRQLHNPDQLDEALESAILLYSRLGDVVVGCFLPSPEIISVINRLDRRGLFAEPDLKRVNAIISDWKKAGLKAERLN